MTDGRIQIHDIFQNQGDLILPGLNSRDCINEAALTADFLVLGTEEGNISYYGCEDWTILYEFKHTVIIRV